MACSLHRAQQRDMSSRYISHSSHMAHILIHLPTDDGGDGAVVVCAYAAINPARFDKLRPDACGYVLRNEAENFTVLRWDPSHLAPYERFSTQDRGNHIRCEISPSDLADDNLYKWVDDLNTRMAIMLVLPGHNGTNMRYDLGNYRLHEVLAPNHRVFQRVTLIDTIGDEITHQHKLLTEQCQVMKEAIDRLEAKVKAYQIPKPLAVCCYSENGATGNATKSCVCLVCGSDTTHEGMPAVSIVETPVVKRWMTQWHALTVTTRELEHQLRTCIPPEEVDMWFNTCKGCSVLSHVRDKRTVEDVDGHNVSDVRQCKRDHKRTQKGRFSIVFRDDMLQFCSGSKKQYWVPGCANARMPMPVCIFRTIRYGMNEQRSPRVFGFIAADMQFLIAFIIKLEKWKHSANRDWVPFVFAHFASPTNDVRCQEPCMDCALGCEPNVCICEFFNSLQLHMPDNFVH